MCPLHCALERCHFKLPLCWRLLAFQRQLPKLLMPPTSLVLCDLSFSPFAGRKKNLMMLFDCDIATHFMHKIMAFLFSSTVVEWSCFVCFAWPAISRWPTAAFGKLNKWHFVLIKNVIEIQDATRMAIGRLLESSCPRLRLQLATSYWQATTGAKHCFGEFYF